MRAKDYQTVLKEKGEAERRANEAEVALLNVVESLKVTSCELWFASLILGRKMSASKRTATTARLRARRKRPRRRWSGPTRWRRSWASCSR
jgi:hypothetical protein